MQITINFLRWKNTYAGGLAPQTIPNRREGSESANRLIKKYRSEINVRTSCRKKNRTSRNRR